jgi:hypothetical protein
MQKAVPLLSAGQNAARSSTDKIELIARDGLAPFCRPGFEVADSLNVAVRKRKFCRLVKASSDGIGAFSGKTFDNEDEIQEGPSDPHRRPGIRIAE